MYEIEIDFLLVIRDRKISVSSHSLREIVGFIGQRIFAEYHASYKCFGSSGGVGIRIIRLQKILEMIVMMVSEFYEHEDIRIVVRNDFFYSCIISIVLVDIGK